MSLILDKNSFIHGLIQSGVYASGYTPVKAIGLLN